MPVTNSEDQSFSTGLEVVENDPGDQIKENVEWMLQHINELRAHPSGHPQLAYLERTILPRLTTYRTNITRSDNQLTTPRTFQDNDTTFYH